MTESTSDKPNGKPNPAHVPRKRRKGAGTGDKRRRNFTADFKLRILDEVDAAREEGQGGVGAILRREGLYSSHISKWREQRDAGALAALNRKRGPKPDPDKALRREMAKLERENERLRKRLAQAEAIIEVQKKLAILLSDSEASSGSEP